MKLVTIKMVNGTKYKMGIFPDQTVANLKLRIFNTLLIKIEAQRLLYNGTPLPNEYLLGNLPDDCIIHLVLQLVSIPE